MSTSDAHVYWYFRHACSVKPDEIPRSRKKQIHFQSTRILVKMQATVDYNGASTVPAFLSKLWALVEDSSTDELICWDSSGKAFHVFDQGRFAKEILPQFFKHSNISSFIRQLNMYGFRKVSGIGSGSMKLDKDDVMFQHPYFQRGLESLLEFIKRKPTGATRGRSISTDEMKVNAEKALQEVHTIKQRTEDISTTLDTIKRENEALWRELANQRQQNAKQQTVLNKLVQFLVHLVSGLRGLPTRKRKLPMLNDASQLAAAAKLPKYSPALEIQDTGNGIDYTVESPPDSSRHNFLPLPVSPLDTMFQDVTDLSTVDDTTCILDKDHVAPPPYPGKQMSNETAKLTSRGTINSGDDKPNLVAPKDVDNAVLSGELDNIQNNMDSVKDLIAATNLNLDTETLLSLFSADGPVPTLPDNIFDVDISENDNNDKANTNIVGNELIQYTQPQATLTDIPNFYDDETNLFVPFDFDSHTVDPTINFNLDTPIPSTVTSEPDYKAKASKLMEEVD